MKEEDPDCEKCKHYRELEALYCPECLKKFKVVGRNIFENKLKVFEKDPAFRAEIALLALTECFYKINPNPSISVKWAIKLIEWLTDKVIYGWRK